MSSVKKTFSGREYWSRLTEAAADMEVVDSLNRSFLESDLSSPTELNRRNFLSVMAASLSLAGVTLSGCRRWPTEQIRPHTARPEGTTPGVPVYYATICEQEGFAQGLLAKSYDGRPIKLEGNRDHPTSAGATTVRAQASLLQLYDPERSRRIIQRDFSGNDPTAAGTDRSWADFEAFATPHFKSFRDRKGQGLAILAQPSAGPTWNRLRNELASAMPEARWFFYQPIHRDFEIEGSRQAFGRVLRPQYHLESTRVIACFDCDLLGNHPAQLVHARDWASGRRNFHSSAGMNRLYAIEPSFSITGSVADRRLAVRPSIVARCVSYLAAKLGLLDQSPDGLDVHQTAFLDALLADLGSQRGNGLVAIGPSQPASIHHSGHAINEALRNLGSSVDFTEEPLADFADGLQQIRQLCELLQGDVIKTLVIIGGNPAYDAPADAALRLSNQSPKLTTIYLGDYDNETAEQATWNLPAAHFLECWGDGRGWDGTYAIQQPLIEPFFGGKSPIELLAMLHGQTGSALGLVRATFDQLFPAAGDDGWEQTLHDGFRDQSSYPEIEPPRVNVNRGLSLSGSPREFEACFVPDNKMFDGRFANNAWLQELPDPLTKLTWDNAALISKADSTRTGVKSGDIVRIESHGFGIAVDIAAFVMPGQAVGAITLPVGYGRKAGGAVGRGVGFNVYPLRTLASSYIVDEVQIRKTGLRYPLVTTQLHHLDPSIADLALKARLGEKGKPGLVIHECNLPEYQRDPHSLHGHSQEGHLAPLYDSPSEFDQPHKWGMAIDLNACLGCSNCVVACQAENNIPVVGKTNVAMSREMHWLRIDRYFKGPVDDPDIVYMPTACVHCENAPCEQVCPVAATVHDSEGLNSMVYNRCIGTRYCANNCPYKVRRFNYLEYHANHPRTPAKPWLGIPDQQQLSDVSPLKHLLFNPEVTVRMRGVMEKCTYCVQRIVDARIRARNEHAQGLRDSDLVNSSELQTACQSSCPTQAIVFGDLNDKQSEVARAKADVRNYEVLGELNLRPRTTYLGKIRNS